VAWLIRKNTTVRNAWVSEALSMGHEVNVSQAVSLVDQALLPELAQLKAAVEKGISR
jgi:BarA-like signal transduction histidine kinase